MRLALSTAMMALLAGCTSVEDPFLTSSVSSVGAVAPPLASEVSPAYALAGLPSAIGAPRSVRQTLPAGDMRINQVIVYGNDTGLHGENTLTVESGRSADGRFVRVPSERTLRVEMAKALPGVPMRISPAIGENIYGIYGYATGPYSTGGACIYGWQLADTSGADTGRFLNRAYKAQIRLRFCDQRISEERIPLLMKGLTLKAVNSGTIATLRNTGGTGAQAGVLPLYGADALFDAPREEPVAASAPEERPAPVARPARRVAAAPRTVMVEQPRYVTAMPASAGQPAPAGHPAPGVLSVSAQQPVAPRVLNAARVPMPGERLVDTATTGTIDGQSPDALEAVKQKASSAWAAAKARLGGTPAAGQ